MNHPQHPKGPIPHHVLGLWLLRALAVSGIMISPLFRRVLHHFHLDRHAQD
jgi:hypothetical protein